MIAIAESGSTKCEWVILNDDHRVVSTFKTQGYNPYFHDSDFVFQSISCSEDFLSLNKEVKEVYFYGAGCSSESLNKIISNGLQRFFKGAQIVVDHDLLAAAYSLYEEEPVIVGILGTGSNSCFYDGACVKEEAPALGFIMGDEAGGAYYGKKLLSDFFYKKMPAAIEDDFVNTYHLNWNEARKNIYGNIHANVYLASFMPFIAKHRESTYVIDMMRKGFADFISIHVDCFKGEKTRKVGFVGSIAFIFKDLLKRELAAKGYEAGRIIKSPVNELVNYHKKYILNSESNVISAEEILNQATKSKLSVGR